MSELSVSARARLQPANAKRAKHVPGAYSQMNDPTTSTNVDDDSSDNVSADNSSTRKRKSSTSAHKNSRQTRLSFAPNNNNNNNKSTNDDDDDVNDKSAPPPPPTTKTTVSTTTTSSTIRITRETDAYHPDRVYGAVVTDSVRTSEPVKKVRGADVDIEAHSKSSWTNVAFELVTEGGEKKWRCLVGDCEKRLACDGSNTTGRRRHVEALHKTVFEKLETAQARGKGEPRFRRILEKVAKTRQLKIGEEIPQKVREHHVISLFVLLTLASEGYKNGAFSVGNGNDVVGWRFV